MAEAEFDEILEKDDMPDELALWQTWQILLAVLFFWPRPDVAIMPKCPACTRLGLCADEGLHCLPIVLFAIWAAQSNLLAVFLLCNGPFCAVFSWQRFRLREG